MTRVGPRRQGRSAPRGFAAESERFPASPLTDRWPLHRPSPLPAGGDGPFFLLAIAARPSTIRTPARSPALRRKPPGTTVAGETDAAQRATPSAARGAKRGQTSGGISMTSANAAPSLTSPIGGRTRRICRAASRRAVQEPLIRKLCVSPALKSNTSSKSSRRSSLVFFIWPMRIRLNTISPKSPVVCTPQLLKTHLAMYPY